jgi:hypothetical protein
MRAIFAAVSNDFYSFVQAAFPIVAPEITVFEVRGCLERQHQDGGILVQPLRSSARGLRRSQTI